jgi:photosystem II stability/assembly factor-like uncharacterized protein
MTSTFRTLQLHRSGAHFGADRRLGELFRKVDRQDRMRNVSVLVVVVLVSTTCSGGHSSSHARVPPSSTLSTTAPTLSSDTTTTALAQGIRAAGLEITDLSWISATQGWAVGVASTCGSGGSCAAVLLGTVDGGRQWALVETTNTPADCTFGCAPSSRGASDVVPTVTNIRFVTDRIGFAFGQTFTTTTDGGHRWVAQTGRKVAALEVAGREVIRVSYSHTGCPGPCDWGIDTAAIGSTAWRPVRFPEPTHNDAVQLVRSGLNDVYVAFFGNPASGAGTQTADLVVSHDGGRTWTRRSDPCSKDRRGENDSYAIAAAPGGVVVSVCNPRGQNGGGFVVISDDGSRTYGSALVLPDRVSADDVAITSPGDVFVTSANASGPVGPRLYASHDSGHHWSVAITEAPQPNQNFPTSRGLLKFLDPTHGYWLGNNQTLWTTTDGGTHWTPYTIH